jgi:UDP-glucose 4-epimerase
LKALVTGGAGFIGSHIVDAYLEAGHDVIVVDDLSSGRRSNLNPEAKFEELDIRSPEAARLVAAEKPDVINNHAAQMNVRHSVEEPRFDAEVNILGVINLLEAARDAGTRRFILAASGGTVYGEPQVFPSDESQPTRPLCPYGISKLAGEQYLYYYSAVFGLPYVALRYANVYGPRQDPHGEAGVVAIFCERLLGDRDVTINGDGEQTRDYVFIADVVRSNLAALDTPYNGAVNIGSGTETTVIEIFDAIKSIVGGTGTASHGPSKDGEVRRSCLDSRLAGERLGWAPVTPLAEGLGVTVDFFRSRL